MFNDPAPFYQQMKREIKLCNNMAATKRGEFGYDPAYKFDLRQHRATQDMARQEAD